MEELFLEAELKDGSLNLPISSAISVFSLKFLWQSSLEEIPLKLCFVVQSTADNFRNDRQGICSIPITDLGFAKVIPSDCVPTSVARCLLPVITTHGGLIVHCGLCAVLRTLVIHLDSVQPNLNLVEILGFRGMCLKSCAEVSVWTKFCESQVPQLVTALNQEHEINYRRERPHQDVLHLEEHFSEPPAIPNINKRKRKMKENLDTHSKNNKTLKSETTGSDENKTICDTIYREVGDYDLRHLNGGSEEVETNESQLQGTINSSRIEHVFAEGADFTLTDLILYPCISYVLDSYGDATVLFDALPKVCTWYCRLKSTKRFQIASSFCRIPLVDLKLRHISETAAPSKSANKNESKLVKKKIKVNTAEAVPLIDILKSRGVELAQDSHPCAGEKLDWESMPPAVHPLQGSLPDKRVDRKCEQLENLALAVRSIASPGDVIVDFCAGGGHLGLVIAYLLPLCQVLLVENKQESIRRAVDRARAANITNVTLYQSNLDYFTGRFDIGTCLHACGVATDLVLNKCRDVTASFVVCPCCYGGVQETGAITYPRSQFYRTLGFTYQDYLLLARAADDQKSGKEYMTAVDKDRNSLFKEIGYTVILCSLQPLACSPKNNLLIGVKR